MTSSPDKESKKTPPAFDDIPSFVRATRVTGVSAHPSGPVIATVCEANEKGTAFVSQLVAIERGADGTLTARYLTHGTESASLLAIGGRGEVYFSRKDGTEEEKGSAVWMLPPSGEARVVLRRFEGVDSLQLTDTGVVLTASVLPSAKDLAESDELAKKRSEAKTAAVLYDSFPIRRWNVDCGPTVRHLFVAPLPELYGEGELELAEVDTPPAPEGVDEWRLASAAAGPDGATVLVTMQARNGITDTTQVWRLDFAGALGTVGAVPSEAMPTVADAEVSCEAAAVAPDGTWALLGSYLRPRAGQVVDDELLRLDLATGELTVLTDGFDNSDTGAVITESGNLFVTANRRGRGGIFKLQNGAGSLLTDDDEYAYSSLTYSAGHLVALRSSVAEPATVVFIDPENGAAEEAPRLGADLDLPGELTEITATAADGTDLRAWLAVPETDGPSPLMVFAHGGPWGSWNDWTWRWNPWPFVARGYAVLMPDPGISTGYGKRMVSRGHDALGDEPFTDIMALADTAVARPDIDETRQGFAGGSYGGYMANWVAGHTGARFKCVVTHAGLWDIETMSKATDNGQWYTWMMGELPTGGTQANLWSPHLFADRIEAPMLVIHGDKDYRVPFNQALELWQDLQRLHPEAGNKFLYFPDEGHWILKPANAQIWYETFIGFLDEHVRGAEFTRSELLG